MHPYKCRLYIIISFWLCFGWCKSCLFNSSLAAMRKQWRDYLYFAFQTFSPDTVSSKPVMVMFTCPHYCPARSKTDENRMDVINTPVWYHAIGPLRVGVGWGRCSQMSQNLPPVLNIVHGSNIKRYVGVRAIWLGGGGNCSFSPLFLCSCCLYLLNCVHSSIT